jgi:hypothetical protein
MLPPEIHRPAIDALGIDSQALALAMGYPDGTVPDYLEPVVAQVLEEGPKYLDLVCGWRVFAPTDFHLETEGMVLKQVHFDTGRIIASGLRKAEGVAFFVATAGPGIVTWRDAAFSADVHPVLGFTIDAYASEVADRVAEWLDQRLSEEMRDKGWGTTDRYSPGYCDWNVAEQHKLFSLLPAGFCGVSLTESALMTPLKSVSGVIGFGVAAKKHGYVCQLCTLESCFRRNLRKV